MKLSRIMESALVLLERIESAEFLSGEARTEVIPSATPETFSNRKKGTQEHERGDANRH